MPMRKRKQPTSKTCKSIFVTVRGGVAEVDDSTVPEGILVEILDFDDLSAAPETAKQWSPEARAYAKKYRWL
jgi:hypothetical protein